MRSICQRPLQHQPGTSSPLLWEQSKQVRTQRFVFDSLCRKSPSQMVWPYKTTAEQRCYAKMPWTVKQNLRKIQNVWFLIKTFVSFITAAGTIEQVSLFLSVNPFYSEVIFICRLIVILRLRLLWFLSEEILQTVDEIAQSERKPWDKQKGTKDKKGTTAVKPGPIWYGGRRSED